jgi:hypothetical protein
MTLILGSVNTLGDLGAIPASSVPGRATGRIGRVGAWWGLRPPAQTIGNQCSLIIDTFAAMELIAVQHDTNTSVVER